MRRIAVLQHEWPLQVHTANLVRSLAAAGYQADLILYGCSTSLVDMAALAREPGVRLYNLRPPSPAPLRLVPRLLRLWERVVQKFAYTPLLLPALSMSYRLFRSRGYDCVIGVEKKGMIWAALTARVTGIPHIYYSLELYDEEHPYFFRRPGFPALRRAEKFHHRKAMATIIQDPQRGAHLMRLNGLSEGEVIYLPVSVPGEPICEGGNFFHSRFPLSGDLPVVLYLGLIEQPRNCLDVARVAGRNADCFTMVFHGYGQDSFLDRIREEGGGSVVISTELVAEDRLPAVVASARIGLVLYRRDCANDHLTAFSSEKVALYCRAGVPFIAFDTESYRSLKARFDCCVLIDDVEQLPDAVRQIEADYERFRENAFRAFTACYCYADNVAKVIGRIGELLSERKEAARTS